MKIIRKITLAALLVPALMVGATYAAEPGFYLGGSAGQTNVDKDVADFASGAIGGNSNAKVDDDDTGWKVYLGYNFLPWLGVEAGYADFGTVGGKNVAEVDLSGWDGFLVGTLPIGAVDLFAKIGAISLETELKAPGYKNTENDGKFAYGVGIAYNINHWSLRAEAEGFDDDSIDDFYFLSAGVVYRFFDDKPAPVVAEPAAPEACADTDNDGVCNTDDICMDTPTGKRVDTVGCSCDYTLALEFAFDSAELSANDKARLDELVPVLTNPKDTSIAGVIDGYTDVTGRPEYNMGLSERRAASVDNYLHSKGVATGRFIPHGYGETNPVASNDTEEGRAQNRRIELRRTDCGAK
jgi:outer membrane protein OmpA-like peptidoglycan-associated protein